MIKKNPQSGQTLIETITAIFILTVALVSALGLAIYATSTASITKNEVIATNLAREGIEVIRMFRDTNWLAASGGSASASPLTSCTFSAATHPCYPEGFDSPFPLQPTSGDDSYRLVFDPAAATGWILDTRDGAENYMLCLQQDGTYRHNKPGVVACGSDAQYARRVTITLGSTTDPYTPDSNTPSANGSAPSFGGHSPELIITSTVVWQGKNCNSFPVNPEALDPMTYDTKCRISTVERLSNWKDYD